eukprot:SAG31_NODE_73_length_27793_cov_26.900520_9_plen_154_part_00
MCLERTSKLHYMQARVFLDTRINEGLVKSISQTSTSMKNAMITAITANTAVRFPFAANPGRILRWTCRTSIIGTSRPRTEQYPSGIVREASEDANSAGWRGNGGSVALRRRSCTNVPISDGVNGLRPKLRQLVTCAQERAGNDSFKDWPLCSM